MSSLNFFEISKNVAANFLQTVVAVDDELSFDSHIQEVADSLEEPESNDLGISDDASSIKVRTPHPLDYDLLSKSFAKKGLICSGIKPVLKEVEQETINDIVRSMERSDLSILDWEMLGKRGDFAISVIKKLIDLDVKADGRLRLICIYTGLPKGDRESNVIADLRRNLESINGVTVESNKKDVLDFKLGHSQATCWRIFILGKNDVTEDQLPEKLVNSFTEMTAGLLSNATLSAITEIRKSTHHLLSKFRKELDPAYISHILGLISLPDARERAAEIAFDYAINLISEEIRSNLQISESLKNSLSTSVLEQWPDHVNSRKQDRYFYISLKGTDKFHFGSNELKQLFLAQSQEEINTVVTEKLNISPTNALSPIERFKEEPIAFFTNENKSNTHLYELSVIQSVRRDSNFKYASGFAPSLKQGTILKRASEGSKASYYLCIQPLCDSVRLTCSTNFMFLYIVENGSFSHAIRHKSDILKFKIDPHPKKIQNFLFEPTKPRNEVIGEKIDSDFQFKGFFEDPSKVIEFQWIGELKENVVQAIVNDIAAKVARVGLDSFEWLRIKSTRNN
jgi:Response receiver domain